MTVMTTLRGSGTAARHALPRTAMRKPRRTALRRDGAGGIRMDGVEAEGRTVSEATDRALTLLNLRADQVSVEVLSQGRPRLLGFGGEPARVRVTPLADAEPADEGYDDDDEEE